jgi:hypothetical protein
MQNFKLTKDQMVCYINQTAEFTLLKTLLKSGQKPPQEAHIISDRHGSNATLFSKPGETLVGSLKGFLGSDEGFEEVVTAYSAVASQAKAEGLTAYALVVVPGSRFNEQLGIPSGVYCDAVDLNIWSELCSSDAN